ncbi:MAG: hypothetical protein Satyrvirus2_53 [Satyrvirus sp.]|uniref:Uncharacterized protein n=1 Tax=Satyrvirus sp. TaxID=2487771 RepID=A0A3G5ACZ8_9VIRU|nr:MAG: hypothetical protein Satyrvirus2_53 [Satyrvirus sp.]
MTSPGVNKIPILIELFEKKLIKPEYFSPFFLMKFIKCHNFSNYKFDILDILIKYIPKEYWIDFQLKIGETILHCIVGSNMADEKIEYYFKLFVDMGVDPTVLSLRSSDLEGNITEPYTAIKILIYKAIPNCIKYILTKFSLNSTYFNEIFETFGKTYVGENALMSCLRTFSLSKNRAKIDDVKETFRICVENGLDLGYASICRYTIYDYVLYYGWKPVFENIITISENQVKKVDPLHNGKYWRINRTKRFLVEEIRNNTDIYSKFPFSLETHVAILDTEGLVKYKLKNNKYEKNSERISILEKEFLEHLQKIKAHKTILQIIYQTLNNDFHGAYGFLHLPTVKKFFDDYDF